jgi:hypothetical protein
VEFERSGGPTISFDLFLRVIGDDGTVLEAGAWSLLESDPGVAPARSAREVPVVGGALWRW